MLVISQCDSESNSSLSQGVDDDLFDEAVGFEDYEVSETQWLCSNLTEKATGLPMGGERVRRHALVHWQTGQGGPPIKVGLLAVSENWLSRFQCYLSCIHTYIHTYMHTC